MCKENKNHSNIKTTKEQFKEAVKRWGGKVVELQKDYALVGDKKKYTIKIDICLKNSNEIIIKEATLQKEEHMFAWLGLQDELKKVTGLNS